MPTHTHRGKHTLGSQVSEFLGGPFVLGKIYSSANSLGPIKELDPINERTATVTFTQAREGHSAQTSLIVHQPLKKEKKKNMNDFYD